MHVFKAVRAIWAVCAPRSQSNTMIHVYKAARATTPRILKALLLANCAAAVFLWYVAAEVFSEVHQTIQTISKDSVPSIVAADEIRARLASANANAASAALAQISENWYWAAYEKDLDVVADRL